MPLRTESFIAHRLYYAEHSNNARPAIKVALLGIIIGVMVMVITLSIVVGFKQTITEKVAGFGSHIQLVSFENNNTYELDPVPVPDSLLNALRTIPHVSEAYPFYTKPGILKTADAFQGIILKGTDYWTYFSQNLVEGRLPQLPQEVLVSRSIMDLLKLKVDSSILCYFVGDEVKVRKFTISGVYSTGFGDFDNRFMLTLPGVITQLNQWSSDEASGIEILVDNFANLSEAADGVYYLTANHLEEDGQAYYTQTIEEMNPQIFAWLDLLDMNVVVIIILMLAVSAFNIISGLIILILDSVTMIGTMKALGATNRFLRRIFLLQSAMLVGRGIIWGNIVGIGLCVLQHYTHLIRLDSSTYYVDFVPTAFPVGWWILLSLGTIICSLLVLLAPSTIISRISPAKVMRFE